ncbi:hypothetical protein COLO4_30672 [Corchorus olitorius]|uniref:Uncharacterized protein n=1 Tax=Corchorus olitorius TaxID=93759 RepID=A0A1R3H7P3_9ROSI|nr:hypothetical protein COLO4_30672 [Corchorus olitorius]
MEPTFQICYLKAPKTIFVFLLRTATNQIVLNWLSLSANNPGPGANLDKTGCKISLMAVKTGSKAWAFLSLA